jgi:hypothetical protein
MVGVMWMGVKVKEGTVDAFGASLGYLSEMKPTPVILLEKR